MGEEYSRKKRGYYVELDFLGVKIKMYLREIEWDDRDWILLA